MHLPHFYRIYCIVIIIDIRCYALKNQPEPTTTLPLAPSANKAPEFR